MTRTYRYPLTPQTFAALVRRDRAVRRMTQAEYARHLEAATGIKFGGSHISHYETGKVMPELTRLLAMMPHLKASPVIECKDADLLAV